MKKFLFKSLAFALMGTMVISSLMIPAVAEDDAAKTEEEISVSDTNATSTGTDYASYISKYDDFVSNEEQVSADVSFKVEKESNEFVVDIKTDGLYNLGFSYKTL